MKLSIGNRVFYDSDKGIEQSSESKEISKQRNLSTHMEHEVHSIKEYIEELIYVVDKSRVREYFQLTQSKRALFGINFLAGIGKGLGQGLGFTIFAALIVYILKSWIDLPVIGEYIAKLLEIIEIYREG